MGPNNEFPGKKNTKITINFAKRKQQIDMVRMWLVPLDKIINNYIN